MSIKYKIRNLSSQIISLYPNDPDTSPARKVLTRGEVILPEENMSGYILNIANKGHISIEKIEIPDPEPEETQEDSNDEVEEIEESLESEDELEIEETEEEDEEYDFDDLMSMYRSELDELATELGLNPADYANKQEIANAILDAQDSGL